MGSSCCIIGLLLAASFCAAAATKQPDAGADASRQQRVEAVTAMLPQRPGGFGKPITDRAAWEKLAKVPSYRQVVRQAEGILKQPIPDQPDELYLDYSRTGNRTRFQRVAFRRRGRVGWLVLAECLENKGRFVPALEKTVAALCAERTWILPAHDRGLRNFKGEQIDIDLASSALGWNLAMADYLLGGKLGTETRKLIRDNVHRRVVQPYLDMVAGKRGKNWWMNGTNNWNAVCLAGVTGSALTLVESRQQRATFVVAAEEHSRNFLRGFTPDGYCSEGLGYWGYGFGHYVLLAEAIRQATAGRLDLLARKEVRAAATYAWRIEIIGGVYPAFADCSVRARPSSQLTHFLRRRFRLGADPAEDSSMIQPSSSLFHAMMYSFGNSATREPRGEADGKPGVRTWFEHAGVLVCRPGDRSRCRMGAAMKGGHNAEHHNHNDVGSYVVVVGRRAVLLDPGAEVYTARTFSSRRYESNVLNSFGHPVPRVAGRLQRGGRQARGRVVRTEFTDQADTLALDLRSAYSVKGLKKLQRTFIYSRQGPGSLTVTDEVAFDSPQAFETALITLGRWKRAAPRSLIVYDSDEAVRVDIETTGGEFEVKAEQIREDVRTRSLPVRLGIAFKKPVAAGAITVKITPAARPEK